MKRFIDYTSEEFDKLHERQKNSLSQQEPNMDLKERLSKIYSEPRKWGDPIEEPDIFGVDEMPIRPIHHLIVKFYINAVVLFGYFPEGPEVMEIFKSREKIDSFIEVLTIGRDMVFPE